ncbi:MAG: HAMP domain-containing histidine kinase, partial [bacterium]|nr:HAMP domain-containing histidine kinase [bacterium]
FYDWLSGLTAELVHEIGNPLASVNTTLQVLFDCLETWDIAKQKSYVMRAINEIERLSKYLKKLREFSASDSYIDKSTVFLKALIDEVFDQHRALVEVKKISVSRAISEDLRVFVDHDVFYQVVLNLVQNSLDILPEGGRIWIEVEDVNDYFVKLVYCNNGPPIPKEMMERIFMPFYSTKTGGSGIGLAVSLKLMTRMGGKMQAEIPKNNEGARFVLYIPIFSEEE